MNRAKSFTTISPPNEPTASPVRIAGFAGNEDTMSEGDSSIWGGAPSYYANLTATTLKPAKCDSEAQRDFENDASSGSGTFSRLVQTTVCRKPGKSWNGGPSRHSTIRLNLHQFQTESGDSLGDDPDRWAQLQF